MITPPLPRVIICAAASRAEKHPSQVHVARSDLHEEQRFTRARASIDATAGLMQQLRDLY